MHIYTYIYKTHVFLSKKMFILQNLLFLDIFILLLINSLGGTRSFDYCNKFCNHLILARIK